MTLTRQEAEESKEMEGLRVHADALLSLSSPADRRAAAGEGGGGAFECKTCSKRFPSFQALGGHRTSHTRLQARMLSDPAGAAEKDRARVHECAVCGLEFAMGQALGGHMRRHRGEVPPATAAVSGSGGAQSDQAMPDLNLPPLEEDDGGGGGGDGQEEASGGHSSSQPPQLLNLLV